MNRRKLLRRTVVANGTKRHFVAAQQTVAIGGKADIGKRLERHHAGNHQWPLTLRQACSCSPASRH